ncbi:2-oxoglutarate-Fe(II) type oxidoreductase ppzD-like [Branchiostoma floridae]|uniref:2-oxoglutarate-Fe(II) type oxidoreductase ppzD-like n=1 Tax=Branchiostoma floridae TaxID=7739 RepID=A0A9J7KSN8_BRAFL|nr:2-oxoglutarate-Fe(II) type oxidoreductase ppzD-like [Branchiostoma floridae]XP_035669808.1 2-oxoglutarate-Fe(II) type oxidoreductase ppzD-like [Branchiostoma floridae]
MDVATDQEEKLPIIDFSAYSLQNDETDDDELQRLATRLVQAFSTEGFVYLRNHGIPNTLISKTFAVANKFFSLPEEVKTRFSKSQGCSLYWVGYQAEKVNPARPADIKEAMGVYRPRDNEKPWPNQEVPEFQETFQEMYDKCHLFSLRVLELIARGLQIQDIPSFLAMHSLIGSRANITSLTTLHYPPVPDHVSEGQIRCGEHSDYGSITLLFQDTHPGLEVLNSHGRYIPAPPLADTVVVNIGDLMQRWTSDKIVSNKHRVVIPDTREHRRVTRRSMAFFVNPNDDAVVTCLDGSDKYKPITAGEYVKGKIMALTNY